MVFDTMYKISTKIKTEFKSINLDKLPRYKDT